MHRRLRWRVQEADDRQVLKAQSCPLRAGHRVLLDEESAGGGFVAGCVASVDGGGIAKKGCELSLAIDGEDSQRTAVSRSAMLYVASLPTQMTPGATVRVAYEEQAGVHSGSAQRRGHKRLSAASNYRWFYGKLTKVYPGQELVDIHFDNGERGERMPLYNVKSAPGLGDTPDLREMLGVGDACGALGLERQV